MDKYKTCDMGKALKSVFRGEMSVDDSIKLAETTISDVFKKSDLPPEKETDMGFYGDFVGVCPICKKNVIRSRYGYACTGYKDGCTFKISGRICNRSISITNAKMLLERGKSSKIEGFISKNGKPFNATIKLENGKAVFDF